MGQKINTETRVQICPVCQMEKSEWRANGGKGVMADDIVYCCEGCTDGTGCTCVVPKSAKKRARERDMASHRSAHT